MHYVLTIIFFALGLIIGSFLNVVIFRFNTQKTFGGRSECLHCQKKLHWRELIPLLSFFLLKGRCKKCKSKISAQYPIVECLSGIILAGIFLKFEDVFFTNIHLFSVSSAYYATLFFILLVIVFYDLKHKIIPDSLSLAFGFLAFLGLFFFTDYAFFIHFPDFSQFLSGVLLAFLFALMWFLSKGAWMGLGDAKLALGLGWLMGYPAVISAVFLAFIIGAMTGITLVVFSKQYGMKSEIPFAPFLVLGVWLVFFFKFNFFAMGL